MTDFAGVPRGAFSAARLRDVASGVSQEMVPAVAARNSVRRFQ